MTNRWPTSSTSTTAHEAVDYLAEPLLSGIYGGDPRQLSVRSVLPRFVELANHYGSLTKGVLASRAQAKRRQRRRAAPLFRTLKGGLGQMVDAAVQPAIAPAPELVRGRAQSIERTAPVSACSWRTTGSPADQLVLARAKRTARRACSPPVDGRVSEMLGTVALQLVDDRGRWA